jgi:RNA polymerase sigma factor (sigma-70 family)
MGEMHDQSDAQLLREYAEHGSETAFREIAVRHTDLVYSSALRRVTSPDLARDLAQEVFSDLARKARPLADKLPEGASLVGWLYRSTRFAALTQLRSDRRRLMHERQAMEQLLSNSETAPDWDRIRPVLDEAMDNLSDEDREALLLRYFKNHDFRAVGFALGVSDDAAQKRVSRAVERLREFFAKRGVTVGASGLAVVISANAVQAAPAGLAVTISTAAALAGTTLVTTATATAVKTIAMTTLQKTLITAALAVVTGAGIYEARQASRLREENQTLQTQQAPLADQIQQLQHEQDDVNGKLAGLRDENERLSRDAAELVRLRGEVSRLRREANELTVSRPASNVLSTSDPNWKPNWMAVEPFDLSQFADSTNIVMRDSSTDVGTKTPAALLQTWIWAQRTGDAVGLLKTWYFSEDTTGEFKLAQVEAVQRGNEFARNNPDRTSSSEYYKLRDLFSLGGDRYLALIEEKGLTTPKIVSLQIFRRVGDEWRVGGYTGEK